MSIPEGVHHRVLLPFRHLRWRSAALATAALAVPVCGTVLGLALEGGHPLPALVLTAVVAATGLVLARSLITARLVVDVDGVRLFLPGRRGVRVQRGRVVRAVVRSVHLPDGSGARRRLFLLDAADRPLLRLSDRWWTPEQLGAVARHFAVPVETVPETVQPVELLRAVPQHLAWRERHAFATTAAAVVGAAAACALVGQLAVASL